MIRVLSAFAVLLISALPVYANPVIDIADPLVEIRSFFSGSDILVFGATNCAPQGCDVVVRVTGPEVSYVVREKQKTAGIWVNGQSRAFDSFPGYRGLAATGPLTEIWNGEFPLFGALEEADADKVDVEKETVRFLGGLLQAQQDMGLRVGKVNTVYVRDGRLFRASLATPATAPVGEYTVDVATLENGVTKGVARTTLLIQKAGFEAFISKSARSTPLVYAIVSVVLALGIGFVSATLFTRR